MRPSDTTNMTVERRLQVLHKIADDFSKHLTSVPGTILPPNIRLGVAVCARDTLVNSGNDRMLMDNKVCLRPGASFYDFIAEMMTMGRQQQQQYEQPAFPTYGVDNELDGGIVACLLNIIHAFIYHQNKIDANYYKDAIAAIKVSGILSDYARTLDDNETAALASASASANDNGSYNKNDKENELGIASHAVYCEIILVAAMSHCIHMAFLALGMDVPELPTWEDAKDVPGPSNIRFSSLLKRIRKGDEMKTKILLSFAPYFTKSDLNKDSPEYLKIGENVWKEFKHGLMCPWMSTKFALHDFHLFNHIVAKMYLTFEDLFLRWNKLNPLTHCPSVARFDVETVAAAVAAEHYRGGAPLKFGRPREARDALTEFGSAVAALPFDAGRTERAREKVFEIGGMELVVEACAVAGAFASQTKLIDATGRKLPPDWIQRLMRGVMMTLKHRVSIGLVGVSMTAVFIVLMSLS